MKILYRSLHPNDIPLQVEAFLKRVATKASPTGNILAPCDGAGREYFDEETRYTPFFLSDRDTVRTSIFREPLLYMGSIR
jgi:hypothetical protein